MNQTKKYLPSIIASLLAAVLLMAAYPFFRYYIDPDGAAYLTIARRYAIGDYMRAINGLWSPLGCWFTALFMKLGVAAIPSAVIFNAVGALGFIFITQSFLSYFHIDRWLQWLLNMVLALLMPYVVFWQLFDDIWQAFLLLCMLRVLLKANYATSPALWIWTGLLAALAYFAKGYSFMFFGLNTVCCGFMITRAWQKENRWLWVKLCAVSIVAMIVFSFPWIYLMHLKYGGWSTSTVFKLNLSWTLVGHPYWKEGIHYLIPPVYPDSVSYWEDPWAANGQMFFFWNSFALFKMQVVRIGYMLLVLMSAMNELTCFFVGIWGLALTIICSEKVRTLFPPKLLIVCLSFLLFPAGLILKNAESRYIWYMLPISMVLGGLVLQRLLARVEHRWLKALLAGIFGLSYLLTPVYCCKAMFNEGKQEFETAQQLGRLGVHDSFVANAEPHVPTQRAIRIAYFSGNPMYTVPSMDFPANELLGEMRKYHVKYYFYFCHEMDWPSYIFRDEAGQPFPEVSHHTIPGMKIFQVEP